MGKCSAGDGTSMARYSLWFLSKCMFISCSPRSDLVLRILEVSIYTMQLGLGDVIDRNIPVEVPMENCTPKNVSCGWWHTLLLAESPT